MAALRAAGQLPEAKKLTGLKFPETSPIGFAMTLTPAGLETDLAIPTDVLQAAAGVINKARGAQPAGVPK
jgi:hypothetical protein